ncbi:apyrase-like isoform X2 [Photinus pyralis]|uniref:Apyrase n=1 Tax=Photinus pyralis TaxID=7054 RepID=A0A1Y1L987_PHOPY|nr:apyrase-like isoform X2 [Photinus pyralis]
MLQDSEMIAVKDWRKALKTPPGYRIINKTIRSQTQFITGVALLGLILLTVIYMFPKRSSTSNGTFSYTYNNTYPLTSPIKTSTMHTFRLGIIADLDTNSKSTSDKDTWYSYLKKGYLSYSPNKQTVVVSWDHTDPVKLKTSFALKSRGMELSELVVFDGKLLTFDDRTGMVFEIVNDHAVPWLVLLDGDGRNTKGFKSEWATVKNKVLHVGSMGKEWTTPDGAFVNNDPQYIKMITTEGVVHHLNWKEEYIRLREVLDIHWPGYMIHESGVWSDIHQKWFFLPRRCSKDAYNETLDEHRGCSWLLTADSTVHGVEAIEIPNLISSRGFSSFKFIPTSEDTVIVALRSEELDGKTATYITAFTINGKILLDDTFISDLKYEGLEFI